MRSVSIVARQLRISPLLGAVFLLPACVFHVRQGVGGGMAQSTVSGSEHLALAPFANSLAFGAITEGAELLLVESTTVIKTDQYSIDTMVGLEYNWRLGNTRPYGFRARVEGGARSAAHRPTYGAISVVPGIWTTVAGRRNSAHAFVVALEPRVALEHSLERESSTAAAALLVLSAEYHLAWLPCTLFGGPGCTDSGPDGGGRGWAAEPIGDSPVPVAP